MEDFKKLFIEEATDLIVRLEETLLLLESDMGNEVLIKEVFRIMHSLKGSGAMFGYDHLSRFTHDLETLYDHVRSNKLVLNKSIIEFTFSTIDLIHALLKEDQNPQLLALVTDKQKWIENQLQAENNDLPIVMGKKHVAPVRPLKETDQSLYFINFQPNEDILNDGTNPLYLMDELVDLGEVLLHVVCDKLPGIEELDIEKCYLSWVVILATKADISDLQDVFLFVEEDCDLIIKKLGGGSLLDEDIQREAFVRLLDTGCVAVEQYSSLAKQFDADVMNKVEVDTPPLESKRHETIEVKEKSATDIPLVADTSIIDTVKVSSQKLDTLINLVSELVTTQARLSSVSSQFQSNELNDLTDDFQQLTRQFRDAAFGMRLIPLSTLLVKFKRLVRDLASSLGKKAVLITEGANTELDKNLIAALSDPIMHIIRNAVDHGIENPEIRLQRNKPEQGQIYLKASYTGTNILISIEDDGQGIDRQKVIQKAIEKNLIQPGQEVSDEALFDMLMIHGFSTCSTVSNVSGRGVGMDIVKKMIHGLRGEINISSTEGKGTRVNLKFLLTLSIIDGLLVLINQDYFVIPLSSVLRINHLEQEELTKSVKGIIEVDGEQIPFINLIEKFAPTSNNQQDLHLVIVSYHEKSVGFVVNELVSEYQAVLKPINDMLDTKDLFAGATILGDGQVALVLDTNKTIDFYANQKR